MSTVTRRDLARVLKEEYGGTISGNDEWIQAFIDVLSRKISEEGRVEIRGFGSFSLNTIKAHETVDPTVSVKDGAERSRVQVPESYTVDFRVSKLYKERLRDEQSAKKKKAKRTSKKKKAAK